MYAKSNSFLLNPIKPLNYLISRFSTYLKYVNVVSYQNPNIFKLFFYNSKQNREKTHKKKIEKKFFIYD